MNYTTHLFSYRFQGKLYTVDIVAKDENDAKERLKALAWAEYDGELVARIPAKIGLVAKLIVPVRNFVRRLLVARA